jgi:hypothetical protein
VNALFFKRKLVDGAGLRRTGTLPGPGVLV